MHGNGRIRILYCSENTVFNRLAMEFSFSIFLSISAVQSEEGGEGEGGKGKGGRKGEGGGEEAKEKEKEEEEAHKEEKEEGEESEKEAHEKTAGTPTRMHSRAPKAVPH